MARIELYRHYAEIETICIAQTEYRLAVFYVMGILREQKL